MQHLQCGVDLCIIKRRRGNFQGMGRSRRCIFDLKLLFINIKQNFNFFTNILNFLSDRTKCNERCLQQSLFEQKRSVIDLNPQSLAVQLRNDRFNLEGFSRLVEQICRNTDSCYFIIHLVRIYLLSQFDEHFSPS